MLLDVNYPFFFQAEDGIRDIGVTGVQTCALPISRRTGSQRAPPSRPARRVRDGARLGRRHAAATRSEERRVGKECRSRRSPDEYKNKKTQTSNPGHTTCLLIACWSLNIRAVSHLR